MRVLLMIIVAFLAVGALWLGSVDLFLRLYPQATEHVQFGDVFSAASSLFSALAFMGLLVTIFLQRSELSLQRQELGLQREEMAASRTQLEEQAAAQRALVAATIAQIRVAALQAEIEAIKMDSEQFVPGQRPQYVRQIREAAQQVQDLADAAEEPRGVG